MGGRWRAGDGRGADRDWQELRPPRRRPRLARQAPERTAIITTFTKQLQQQLAHDVARLDSVVPGLLEASDVVKGQSNRLSLRALTVMLADSTTQLAAHGRGRHAQPVPGTAGIS